MTQHGFTWPLWSGATGQSRITWCLAGRFFFRWPELLKMQALAESLLLIVPMYTYIILYIHIICIYIYIHIHGKLNLMNSLCSHFLCHSFVNQWSAFVNRGPKVIWTLRIPRTGGNYCVNDFLALWDDHNIVDELSTVANMCHCGMCGMTMCHFLGWAEQDTLS